MKQICLGVALLFVTSVTAAADTFETKAERVLELTNAVQPSIDMMDRMLDSMAPTTSRQIYLEYSNAGRDVTEADVQELVKDWQQRYLRRFEEEFVPLLVEVYREHFSEEDLDQLIMILDTPAFQRFAALTPALMETSMQAGEQLGARLAMETMQKAKAEHPKFR